MLVIAAVVVGAILFFIGRTVAHFVRRLDEAVTSRLSRAGPPSASPSSPSSPSASWSAATSSGSSSSTGPTRPTARSTTRPRPTSSSPPRRCAAAAPSRSSRGTRSATRAATSPVAGPPSTSSRSSPAPATPVKEPIRVYAGLKSADGQEAQAQLAVDELERTGAFDRSVLAVVTVTGTGWVDPVAAASLEYMHHGDTAIVGTQYSYLPSWISFLVDLDKAEENGRVLVDAVTERWSELPEATRPELLDLRDQPRLLRLGARLQRSRPCSGRSTPPPPRPTACCGPGPPSSTRSGTRSSTGATTAPRHGTPSTWAARQLTVMGAPDEPPVTPAHQRRRPRRLPHPPVRPGHVGELRRALEAADLDGQAHVATTSRRAACGPRGSRSPRSCST